MDDLLGLQELSPNPDNRVSEQSTAALIASSMSGQYEEEWSSTVILHKALATLNTETTSCPSEVNGYFSDYPAETAQPSIFVGSNDAVTLPPIDPSDSCDYTDLDSFQLNTDATPEKFLSDIPVVNESSDIEITSNAPTYENSKDINSEDCAGKQSIVDTNAALPSIEIQRSNIVQPKKSQTKLKTEIPSAPSSFSSAPCSSQTNTPKVVLPKISRTKLQNEIHSNPFQNEIHSTPLPSPSDAFSPQPKRKKIVQPKKSKTETQNIIPSPPLQNELLDTQLPSSLNINNTQAKKIPSYLTAFPMRDTSYPMVYCCNHCSKIYTALRAAQLHECIKRRRGRKANNNPTTRKV